MSRPWIWLQLLIGWAPVWALLVTLLLTAHPGIGVPAALLSALRLILAAAILGLGVQWVARHVRWPYPMRLSFVLVHIGAAALFAGSWVLLNSALESLFRRQLALVVGPGVGPFLVLGCWLYAMIAGVAYAIDATRRAARIEAIAAQSQLAALRAQLHPHFLFNALHMVVQLIPREPRSAAQAAEGIAALLRTTLEEKRDIVSLREEWAFVERYLEIERLRFGERLRVRVELDEDARDAMLPCFALQTLVENAVRHGAMPQVEPTDITVTGHMKDSSLALTVHDSGAGAGAGVGAGAGTLENGSGSGLKRLRERLDALYEGRAVLRAESGPTGGFTAALAIPQDRRSAT